MNGTTEQILADAHAQIEASQLDEAAAALSAILRQEPDNSDAWWLLAHAVRDPSRARVALKQVLRLDPGDEQARALLGSLEERFPRLAEEEHRTSRPGPMSGLPAMIRGRRRVQLPRMMNLSSLSPGITEALLIIVLAVGLGVAAVVALNLAGWRILPPASATPTQELPAVVASETRPPTGMLTASAPSLTIQPPADEDSATSTPPESTGTVAPIEDTPAPGEDEVTAESPTGTATLPVEQPAPEITTTPEGGLSPIPAESPGDSPPAGTPTATVVPPIVDEAATPTGTPEILTVVGETQALAGIAGAQFDAQLADTYGLAGLSMSGGALQLRETEMGQTALASVCLNRAIGLRETVNEAMLRLALLAPQITREVQLLGVEVLDCAQDNHVLRVIAAPMRYAVSWSEGAIEQDLFLSSWTAAG